MKKYKNITSYLIAIDCMTHTLYVSPGEIVTLPMTRDVRYYSRKKQLVVVKRKKEPIKIPVASFKRPKKVEKVKVDPIKPVIGAKDDPIEESQPSKKRGKKPKKVTKETINTMETK